MKKTVKILLLMLIVSCIAAMFAGCDKDDIADGSENVIEGDVYVAKECIYLENGKYYCYNSIFGDTGWQSHENTFVSASFRRLCSFLRSR